MRVSFCFILLVLISYGVWDGGGYDAEDRVYERVCDDGDEYCHHLLISYYRYSPRDIL
jgi:hypothetical protein